jgi:hypothetical protein
MVLFFSLLQIKGKISPVNGKPKALDEPAPRKITFFFMIVMD